MQIVPSDYHPAQDAIFGTVERPLCNTPSYGERDHWQLSVQPFRSGGFEATIFEVDLQAAADRAMRPRKLGTREKTEEPNPLSVESSRARSKSTVRKLVKDMGGDRLVTLTIRQTDELGYWSPDDWEDAQKKFVNLMRKNGLFNTYVSVLEPHEVGLKRLAARGGDGRTHGGAAASSTWDIPLHMHVITRSLFKMPIILMRKMWELASGGRGGINVKWLRSGKGRDAVDRAASYVTKYITKSLGELDRFNKKRYWHAGEPLLPKLRTWLVSRVCDDAFAECLRHLGISDQDEAGLFANRMVFLFPNARGAWLNIRPGAITSDPPF